MTPELSDYGANGSLPNTSRTYGSPPMRESLFLLCSSRLRASNSLLLLSNTRVQTLKSPITLPYQVNNSLRKDLCVVCLTCRRGTRIPWGLKLPSLGLSRHSGPRRLAFLVSIFVEGSPSFSRFACKSHFDDKVLHVKGRDMLSVARYGISFPKWLQRPPRKGATLQSACDRTVQSPPRKGATFRDLPLPALIGLSFPKC